jgi:Asp-tRNA(Asn)/Glu-tRNA(Gln) amidotransferase A subunit family amidase
MFVFAFKSFTKIESTDLASAEKVIGLEFDAEERALMNNDVNSTLEEIQEMRTYSLDNSIPPAMTFNPIPIGFEFKSEQKINDWKISSKIEKPNNANEIAFMDLDELASLLKHQKITSVELTRIYIDRIKKYGDTLQCVITLLEDRAMEHAAKADQEIANGNYKGPLHGVPFGVKDLLALEGYKTTWGAMPFKAQEINSTASVINQLEEVGAVLIAKLTLGALAWGDVWYGGVTKNPWNLEQGSSGSSAGSSSATAAGLVAFSIGTETLGSIVSPSSRCQLTGLRPTYGRVSRTGAMALSWSMDKIGPICRSAKDCAMVFDAIRGDDDLDQTLINQPFNYDDQTELKDLKIGYLHNLFEREYGNRTFDLQSLDILRSLGANLIKVELPEDLPIGSLSTMLSVEAAAAFDELTRSNKDDLLVRQIERAWPNTFRAARFVPAVEYIQMARHRFQLIQKMHALMKEFDAIICPSYGGQQLLITNLTGHPCVVMPNAPYQTNTYSSITVIGNLFDEEKILRVAELYQAKTDYEDWKPDYFK